MVSSAQRRLLWHAVRNIRLAGVQTRNSTSLTSAIKISSIPAPHVGSIAVLSLNRGRARNALSKSLLSELRGVVDGLHAEAGNGSTRALIIASESDEAFCAGADLKERIEMSTQECVSRDHLNMYLLMLDRVSEFLANLRATFTKLATLPIPTISAVGSTAFGGGLELALATTFRVFASTATVGLPETRLAIIPGAGGTYRLPALIGESRARDLILTGRRVAGPEAYFLGLCDRLVEVTGDDVQTPGVARSKVLDQAVAMATDICEGGPLAVKAAVQAMSGWRRGEINENKAYELVINTQDRMAGLKAFAEKEKPAYRGR